MNTITGKITATRHAGTSRMGNPSFDIAVDTGHDVMILTTATNSGLAYGIGNSNYRLTAHTFHLNKRGKVTSAVPATATEE